MESSTEKTYQLIDISVVFMNDMNFFERFKEIINRPLEPALKLCIALKDPNKILRKARVLSVPPETETSNNQWTKSSWNPANAKYSARELSDMKKVLQSKLALPDRIMRGSAVINKFKSERFQQSPIIAMEEKSKGQYNSTVKLPSITRLNAYSNRKQSFKRTIYNPLLKRNTASTGTLQQRGVAAPPVEVETYGKFLATYTRQLDREVKEKMDKVSNMEGGMTSKTAPGRRDHLRYFYWTTDLASYGFATKDAIGKCAQDWENVHTVYK